MLAVKVAVSSLYLALIYWLSLHVAIFQPLFFPTLGAFSYFIITRNLTAKQSIWLVFGAAFASLLGSAAFLWLPELPALLATFILTVILIRRFELNAPPILAVALIPFFDRPDTLWTTPLTVWVALACLAAALLVVEWTAKAASRTEWLGKAKLPLPDESLRS